MKTDVAGAILEPTLPRMWMETGKGSFLYLIERLKPERNLYWYPKKETRIGLDAGEARFEVNGVPVRRPAKGEWAGCVLVPYGLLMPFLKVKQGGLPSEDDRQSSQTQHRSQNGKSAQSRNAASN